MIVDAHVHFWDPGELEYPWLASLPALCRPFLPDDFAHAAGDARAVVVEANCAPRQALREVEFIERLADGGAPIAGIVAYVDLTDESSRDCALDTLSAPPHSRVKGIRHNIQGEPRGFCAQRAFVDGVREAGRRGFTFDLCITSDQLPEAIELADRCPDTRLVLDHCGKPRIRERKDPTWFADIERLAGIEHVWCKISGLLTEAEANCRDDDLLSYTRHVIDCFGIGRVMYGSDWPVLTLAAGVPRWSDHVRALTTGWSESETRRFYSENATQFYRL